MVTRNLVEKWNLKQWPSNFHVPLLLWVFQTSTFYTSLSPRRSRTPTIGVNWLKEDGHLLQACWRWKNAKSSTPWSTTPKHIAASLFISSKSSYIYIHTLHDVSNTPRWRSTLSIPISVCYYSSYAMLQLLCENVILYQAKSFIPYSVQTTYWDVISKLWTLELDDIALSNSE